MENSTEFYNSYYSSPNEDFTSEPNQSLRRYVLREAIRGKALDLGCGEGRNSLFLAGIGFQVTAIDQSETGICKLISRARKSNLPV